MSAANLDHSNTNLLALYMSSPSLLPNEMQISCSSTSTESAESVQTTTNDTLTETELIIFNEICARIHTFYTHCNEARLPPGVCVEALNDMEAQLNQFNSRILTSDQWTNLKMALREVSFSRNYLVENLLVTSFNIEEADVNFLNEDEEKTLSETCDWIGFLKTQGTSSTFLISSSDKMVAQFFQIQDVLNRFNQPEVILTKTQRKDLDSAFNDLSTLKEIIERNRTHQVVENRENPGTLRKMTRAMCRMLTSFRR